MTQRLGRAEAVLGDVRLVLDNTLAAASLLARSPPLVLQEVELAFLVNLVLGDQDAAERRRVPVQWQTDLRELEVEPGLLRLALRNLLLHAFRHGGLSVQVVLRLVEQMQPSVLLLQVIDSGPGLTMPVDAASQPGVGLGLQIVRKVMLLHGGGLQLETGRDAEQPADLVAVGVTQVGQVQLASGTFAHTGEVFAGGAAVGHTSGMPGVGLLGAAAGKAEGLAVADAGRLAVDRLGH